MRSHVIVAVVAFSLGALVVVLARRGPDQDPTHPIPLPIATSPAVSSLSVEELVTGASGEPGSASIGQSIVPSTPRRAAERSTTCILGGQVRSAGEDRLPVPRAYVGLFRPALVDDSPTSAFGQWRGEAENAPDKRQLLTWSYTDEEGRFTFDDLRAGTYIVRAEFGPLLVAATAPQTLVPGEVRAGLDVVLPIAGGLDGVILAPPGVDFEAWRVGLQRSDSAKVSVMSVDGVPEDAIEVRIDQDGTFQVGPAPAGLHRVWLVDRRSGRKLRNTTKVLIGEVTIVEGEFVKREFDLRGGFPGSLQVTLRIPLLERDETPEHLRKVTFIVRATPRSAGVGAQAAVAICTPGGTATVGPLLPGSWSLSVTSGMFAWAYEMRSSVFVTAGQSNDVTIHVPLYEGTLTCLDAKTSLPIAQGALTIGMLGSDPSTEGDAETDQQGRARLMMVPGTYSVAAYAFDNGRFDVGLSETVEWREDGPHPNTIQLLLPVSAPR